MRAHALKEEIQRAGALTGLLLRYAMALITQIAQTAACNRHHRLDQHRRGLEQRACECYSVIRKEYARLLPRCPERTERGSAMAQPRPAQPAPAGVFAGERTAVAQPATVLQDEFG